jgi:hypothetical protein
MAFTDITSTNSVRAALGVSEKEIRDAVLLNPIYTTRLTEALHDMHPTMLADFVTASAVAEAARTEDQSRFVNLVQTYSAYHIAKQCMGSIEMFAPIRIKDDRAEMQRRNDPYAQLRKDIAETLPVIKMRLRVHYPKINPQAATPAPVERLRVLIAPLGTSPITG